jgi:endoglucanase
MVTTANPTNPLANRPWGLYASPHDDVYPYYQQSSGTNRALLAKIALRPRVRWFGMWNSAATVGKAVRDYINTVTHGKPNVLVQLAAFGVTPWEGAACHHTFTAGDAARYRQWVNGMARGIGRAHVAMVLQPDLPFAMCATNTKVPLQEVAYASRVFSSLANTAVYIDVGASDWYWSPQAIWMLRNAGIRYARGFAINDTHYDSNVREIAFGAQIVAGLSKAGIRNKHFVVNTAQNGAPFTHAQYRGSDYNRAAVCTSRTQQRCTTLGIPPTWHVADPRWRLPLRTARTAARLVDAYVWVARPWLEDVHFRFSYSRALGIARSTRF